MTVDLDDLKAKPSRFKPSPLRTLVLSNELREKSEQFAKKYFQPVIELDGEGAHKFELRASKLPFCTLLELHRTLTGYKQKQGYSFDFYVMIGTAVHTVLQKNFPLTPVPRPLVFGNWVCSNRNTDGIRCGYRLEKCTTPEVLVCPKCALKEIDGNLEYDELDFRYKNEFGCHIDLVFELGKKGAKHHMPIEFKTTSALNIQNPHMYLPYEKHIWQVLSYVIVMRANGYKVKYFAMAYVSRDKANEKMGRKRPGADKSFKVFVFKVPEELVIQHIANLDAACKSSKYAKLALTAKKRNVISDNIDKVAALRPCRSREDYAGYMKHTFFGKEECPFEKAGGCFTKRDDVPIAIEVKRKLQLNLKRSM